MRFDVRNSRSLPDGVRERLIRLAGKRVTGEGVLVIEASRLGRRGSKTPSASAASSVYGASGRWSVIPPVSPVSIGWTVVPPVCGVCVVWTVVLPVSVIPRIVVIPISVVTIPGPIGGAAGQYRRSNKNNQENQQVFSHCRTPPWSARKSGFKVLPATIIKRWGGRIIQCWDRRITNV